MQRELVYLLADLCVKWGFCIPPNDLDQISQANYYDAASFAEDVVKAEGMNPDTEYRWVKRISEKFVERFGTDEIDRSTFLDRIRGHKENWNT